MTTSGENGGQPLPTVEQLKAAVQQAPAVTQERQSQFEKAFAVESVEASTKYAHLLGLRDHYKHKKYWSWFLMFLMLLMIGFQSVLLGLVGAGIWDFSKYTWLLPALLVQNLAQIVGLAVFVVKSLFREIGG